MFRSVLDNQQFESWKDYHDAMAVMYEHFDLIEMFIGNPENYRRARLLSRQYVGHRSHVQGLTNLRDVQTWLNENHLELFNVPTIHLDNRRSPVSFNSLKFQNVYADPEINVTGRYEAMTEEEVKGPGWSGEIFIEIPSFPRFDVWSLRFALMSYGIYAHEETFGRVHGKQVCELKFVMLRRDFKLKGFRQKDWEEHDEDDETFHDISDEDFAELKRKELFDDDLQMENMDLDDAFD